MHTSVVEMYCRCVCCARTQPYYGKSNHRRRDDQITECCWLLLFLIGAYISIPHTPICDMTRTERWFWSFSRTWLNKWQHFWFGKWNELYRPCDNKSNTYYTIQLANVNVVCSGVLRSRALPHTKFGNASMYAAVL